MAAHRLSPRISGSLQAQLVPCCSTCTGVGRSPDRPGRAHCGSTGLRLSSSRPCSRNARRGCECRRAGPASVHRRQDTPSSGRQHAICYKTVEEVSIEDGSSECRFPAVAVPRGSVPFLERPASPSVSLGAGLAGKGLRARGTIPTSPPQPQSGGPSPRVRGFGLHPEGLDQFLG